jgi:aspartate racemase
VRIGILGGMGALAGVRFLSMVVEECQKRGSKEDSDFPEITFVNLTSRGMNNTGVINADVFLKDLQYGVNILRRSGVYKIVMACNTAYLFLHRLRHDGTDILDMPKLAVQSLNGDSFGVICSDTSRLNKLYGEAIYCTDDQQVRVDTVIDRVMSGKHCEPDRLMIGAIMNELKQRGAKQIILGCTELPLVMRSYEEFVDPYEIVIKKLLS